MSNGTATATARPASDKAAAFWLSLRTEMIDALAELTALNGGDAAEVEATRAEVTNTDGLSAARASREIDAMRATNVGLRRQLRERRAAANRVAEAADAPSTALVEDRLYEVDGAVYRTVKSGSGNLYAKILDTATGRFEYAAGAITLITPAHRMTVERAKELSIKFARCVRCGRELSADVSVERGIGPVCITKI